MLINLSITSLFASSLSSSPFFSNNAQYKLNSCQFNMIFPIIFFQTTKLQVRNSYFTKLQSELIMINSEDFPRINFNDSALENFIKVDDEVNFIQCRFCELSKTGSETVRCTVSFKECLFYRIYTKDSNTFFQFQEPQQLNIVGCCFSDIIHDGILFDITSGGPIIFDSNIITISKLGNLVYSDGQNFKFKYGNITSNDFSEVLKFSGKDQITSVDSSLFNNNGVVCLLSCDSNDGTTDISSVYSIYNKFKEGTASAPFKGPNYAILYVFNKYISLTNSVFDQSSTFETSHTLTLFAILGRDPSSYVTLVNNSFSISIYDHMTYQADKVDSTLYENNNRIYNGIIPTTVITMNLYLYENYRQECQIYLYPTTAFTESAKFTPSSDFTPSSVFTATSLFTASSVFTPSHSFTTAPPTPPPPSASPSPSPSASPSVNVAYGVVGAVGTAVVSFGISSLIWLSIRRFCIYDHNNYLHMDV